MDLKEHSSRLSPKMLIKEAYDMGRKFVVVESDQLELAPIPHLALIIFIFRLRSCPHPLLLVLRVKINTLPVRLENISNQCSNILL